MSIYDFDLKQHRKYDAVHHWIKRNYGKATKCEMLNCISETRKEWSLKKGFEYDFDINNFWQLCASCHRKYDWTEEQTRKLSEIMKKRVFTPEIRRNMSKGQQGRKLPPEVIKKMVESQKIRWALRKERGLKKFNP